MKIYEIEQNVAIPEVHSKIKYPWPDMEVGESVLIQAEKGAKLYSLKHKVALLHGIMEREPLSNSIHCLAMMRMGLAFGGLSKVINTGCTLQ